MRKIIPSKRSRPFAMFRTADRESLTAIMESLSISYTPKDALDPLRPGSQEIRDGAMKGFWVANRC